MQETRFQIYLAQQHIEEINYNRFVLCISVYVVSDDVLMHAVDLHHTASR